VTAVALDPNTSVANGISHGQLAVGGSLTLNVTQGTAASCVGALAGTDGFKYDSSCSAALRSGGMVNGSTAAPYQGAYSLRIDGGTPSTFEATQVEMNGQQLVYGPTELSGVLATRRLFVPVSGGFARFLDTITNPSGVPVTLDVQIEGTLAGIVGVIVDPSTTGNTYAVTQATGSTGDAGSGSQNLPALAHVFGGPAATAPVSAVAFQPLIGTSLYRWTVTIPAGQAVTLMHFAVQRAPFDTGNATTQAQALVNLTDPNALSGMTAADKAQVVNFKIQ
jgi:hypothetical protein